MKRLDAISKLAEKLPKLTNLSHKRFYPIKNANTEGGNMEEKINPFTQNQWEAEPDEELKIPESYITGLCYEIIVFNQKKTFTFRCKSYKHQENGAWLFENIIIDTSKRNPKGEVELKRVTYHPEAVLVNIPFMVIPAPESAYPTQDG